MTVEIAGAIPMAAMPFEVGVCTHAILMRTY